MSESIFLRVRRILASRVEDLVDAMGRPHGEDRMREALCEVDRAIDEILIDQDKAMTRRLQDSRQEGVLTKKIEELTQKARLAMREGHEEQAEAAISRQIDVEAQVRLLHQVQSLARVEEGELEESLTALRARKRQMEEALADHAIARLDAVLGCDSRVSGARNLGRRNGDSDSMEQRRAGGGEAQTGVAVGEAAAVQKSAIVARRLAALRREDHAA